MGFPPMHVILLKSGAAPGATVIADRLPAPDNPRGVRCDGTWVRLREVHVC